MIISDKYKFVFIHIPKCAGTYFRKIITENEPEAISINYVDNHPVLGKTDYTHIPLSVLEKHFPDEYKKAQNYYSFAIVRDPHKRFPSSFYQRIRMYKNRNIYQMSIGEINHEVKETITLLEKHRNSEILPPDLIHFQKQYSYVFYKNQQIVKAVYSIENIDSLFHDLEKRLGLNSLNYSPEFNKNHSSKIYKSDCFRILIHRTLKFTKPLTLLIPLRVKKTIKDSLTIPPSTLEVFKSDLVKNFIDNYYGQDVQLYNRFK